jgi:hypothetical protein
MQRNSRSMQLYLRKKRILLIYQRPLKKIKMI